MAFFTLGGEDISGSVADPACTPSSRAAANECAADLRRSDPGPGPAKPLLSFSTAAAAPPYSTGRRRAFSWSCLSTPLIVRSAGLISAFLSRLAAAAYAAWISLAAAACARNVGLSPQCPATLRDLAVELPELAYVARRAGRVRADRERLAGRDLERVGDHCLEPLERGRVGRRGEAATVATPSDVGDAYTVTCRSMPVGCKPSKQVRATQVVRAEPDGGAIRYLADLQTDAVRTPGAAGRSRSTGLADRHRPPAFCAAARTRHRRESRPGRADGGTSCVVGRDLRLERAASTGVTVLEERLSPPRRTTAAAAEQHADDDRRDEPDAGQDRERLAGPRSRGSASTPSSAPSARTR